MLPSIGYAPAAGPGAAHRAPNTNAARNTSQSKDESFDQVFASTSRQQQDSSPTSGHDVSSPREARDDSQQSSTDQASGTQSVAKESNPQPAAAPQCDALQPEIDATAPPEGSSAGNKADGVAGRRRPAQAVSAGSARPLRNGPPAANPLAGLVSGSAGSPLDPSSLTMLLGAGAARVATPTAEPGATAKTPEADGDKEAQAMTGLAAQAQKNATGSGDSLAFALRLSHAEAVVPETDIPSSPGGAVSSLSSFSNELEAAAGKAIAETKIHPAEENGGGVPAVGTEIFAAAPAPGNRPAEPEAAANVAAAPAAEPASQASAPVRAVRVQLATEGNQRVNLTLVERAGALSVSVRSADSNLARSLQEHLPDLSARLSEQRYQTELWAPRAEAPSLSAGSGEAGDRNFQSGGQKHGGQSGDPNPEQQQGGRERKAPAWFEELAAIGRTPQIRSEYLWVQ